MPRENGEVYTKEVYFHITPVSLALLSSSLIHLFIRAVIRLVIEYLLCARRRSVPRRKPAMHDR